MNPLSSARVLDQFFLEARSKLLDLAGILDRIGRGDDLDSTNSDGRRERIDRALEVLRSDATNKAEQIQQVFSLEYDPNWKRPKPRI
jgi:hypothetical protein